MSSSESSNPYVVGLTGGIASGKSTIASFFEDLGVPVVDTDIVAREVVQPGMPALDEIRSKFGDDVFAADGALDRRALRNRVFADDNERRRLEAILHPRIREESFRQVESADGPYVIVVVPLLYESPMKAEMDRIVVVDCTVETQLSRLLMRDKESEEQGRRIIATQASREERLSIADDIVNNDGDLDDGRDAVAKLHEKYLALAREAD